MKTKELKKCNCGKPVLCKGLCSTCYQREKHGYKGIKGTTKYNIDIIFENVLSYVKEGYTIDGACVKSGVTRDILYRLATPLQKTELHYYKALNPKDKDIKQIDRLGNS